MGDSLQLLNVDTLNAKIFLADSICGNSEDFGTYSFAKFSCELLENGVISVMIYVVLMITLVGIFYKKGNVSKFFGRHLSHFFIGVWTIGFLIYNIGMFPDYSNMDNMILPMLGVAPMAIVDAFGMFIFQSDVSAIHSECHNNSWYMFFFSITHFFAAFISLLFVVRLFSFNIAAYIIRFWKTYIRVRGYENLYIFLGMNDATYYLAKDMITKGKLDNGIIVIIRIPNEKESTNAPLGIERLFSFLSLTTNNLEHLQELQELLKGKSQDILTVTTFGSLTNIKESADNDILRRELRLHSIQQHYLL